MKRTLITICTLLVTLTAPLAAAKVEGYLVDKMCSAKVLKEGGDAAKAHTKGCAMGCKESGFGVVTSDGKFIKFDKDGDGMALKMLGMASKDDNIEVVVNGEVKGDTMTVVAIQFR